MKLIYNNEVFRNLLRDIINQNKNTKIIGGYIGGSYLYDRFGMNDIDIILFVEHVKKEDVFSIAYDLQKLFGKEKISFIGPVDQPCIYVDTRIPIQIILANPYLKVNDVKEYGGIVVKEWSSFIEDPNWRWDKGKTGFEIITKLTDEQKEFIMATKTILQQVNAYGPPFRITAFNLINFAIENEGSSGELLEKFKSNLDRYTKLEFVTKRAKKVIDHFIRKNNFMNLWDFDDNEFGKNVEYGEWEYFEIYAFHPKWWNEVYGNMIYKELKKNLSKYYKIEELEYDVNNRLKKIVFRYKVSRKEILVETDEPEIVKEKIKVPTIIKEGKLYILGKSKPVAEILEAMNLPIIRNDKKIVLFDFDGTLKYKEIQGTWLEKFLYTFKQVIGRKGKRFVDKNKLKIINHIKNGDYVIIATYRRRNRIHEIREFIKDTGLSEMGVGIYHGVGMTSPHSFKISCRGFRAFIAYGDTKLDKLMIEKR